MYSNRCRSVGGYPPPEINVFMKCDDNSGKLTNLSHLLYYVQGPPYLQGDYIILISYFSTPLFSKQIN